MKKRILLLGATGDLGIYTFDFLYRVLPSEEYELIPVGKRRTDFFKRYNTDYYQLDITDSRTFDKLPNQSIHTVIHFAGMLPAKMKGYTPRSYLETNILGTFNVLEYCRKHNVDRVIFLKSVADYYGYLSESDNVTIFNDDMPRKFNYMNDHAIYGISKATAADLIEVYHQLYGFKRFIFRIPNVYHYSSVENYYKNGKPEKVSYRYMIESAKAGQPIELWGDPKKGRDFLYIKDFCQIIYKAIIATNDGGEYNVGSGKLTSMEDQVKGIISVFSPEHRRSEIIYCPEKRDCINYLMDIEKGKNELDYEPQYDYIKYLKDYKEEMIKNRFAELYK